MKKVSSMTACRYVDIARQDTHTKKRSTAGKRGGVAALTATVQDPQTGVVRHPNRVVRMA